MKRRRLLYGRPFLLIALVVSILASFAQASTIDGLILISQTGGQYDYGIQLAPNHGLVFTLGNEIILTGLSGVTSPSVLPGLSFCFSNETTTPVSVSIISSRQCPVFDPTTMGVTIDALRIVSSGLTTASVSYQIQTGSEGTLSGTVAGPVATPEAGAGGLAAISLLALFALKGFPRFRRYPALSLFGFDPVKP
jgi:hypothetical protein